MLRQPDGESVYRRCSSDRHHHHLVCRSCGTTVEVDGPAVERWAEKVAAEHGFSSVEHTVEVFGTCTRLLLTLRYRRDVRRNRAQRGSPQCLSVRRPLARRGPVRRPRGRGLGRARPRPDRRPGDARATADCVPPPIAHRGASAAAPENTIPAYRAALRAGATQLDLDVRFTRSGSPSSCTTRRSTGPPTAPAGCHA